MFNSRQTCSTFCTPAIVSDSTSASNDAIRCACQGGEDVPTRTDPHVLVVGDPGLGKSQMLMAVAAAAPRSVYVCGNTAR